MARNPLRMTANVRHIPNIFANKEFLSIMSERIAVRNKLGGDADERADTIKTVVVKLTILPGALPYLG